MAYGSGQRYVAPDGQAAATALVDSESGAELAEVPVEVDAYTGPRVH